MDDVGNPATRNLRLNTELAKKPLEYLEYIVVHELVHLRAARHDAKFVALMDRVMPQWRDHCARLNRLPIDSAQHKVAR